MADGRADLQRDLRLARGKVQELEEERFSLEQQLHHQDRCMRQLQHDNDWLRSEFFQESQLLGVREREIFERGRAADRREHQLKAEVETQKAVIQRHVQDKEAALGRERELKAEVDKQKAVIQRHVQRRAQDKETADKRIRELEACRNNANPVPVPRDSPPATDNARPSKRRRQESPVADQRVSRVERERIDRPLAPKDSRREVPELSLVLVQDENITERVVEKLTSVMKEPNSKKNMELFLEKLWSSCYCIHEVAKKGKSVSKPLTPSQPCRGCGSNIRVKTVVESGRIKLKVGHFTVEV
ncbi:uncharacterized protein FIESC28_04084 [Fusarium coffeatum]|uniref:Uncharacterized protein n=1 Tax=Fusarium coffeatum TaxID=231269 RepID=A0A366S195_9HYPO|nr:uncharacterized protein FIESC28_04084 [Fusarium coffeatum]RBR23089.1 hypothetical protein FIESC28_04084 [Fusarium coffeatum]